MDESFRTTPHKSIIDDGKNKIEIPIPPPKLPKYEFLPHPKAHQFPMNYAEKPTKLHFKRPGLKINFKKLLWPAVGIVGIFLLISSFFIYKHFQNAKKPSLASSQTTNNQPVSIPTYLPKNLTAGFSIMNDLKALKSDVLYYSVTGPNGHIFYVTEQPIPAKFDFSTFNKKFSSPDTFSTSSGSATVGPAGGTVIASLLTNKNTWVIINSTTGSTVSEMEIVVRSLELQN